MFRSRYVFLKHTYRLDAKQIRQLPHKPFCLPNALALSPTTLLHLKPTNNPTCTHKTTQRPVNRQYTESPHPSTSTSLPSLHHTIQKKSAAKNYEITYAKFVTVRKCMNSPKEVSSERYAAKRDKFHEYISQRQDNLVRKLCSENHIILQGNLRRKFKTNTQKSHKEIS